jgi:hypothetical protein
MSASAQIMFDDLIISLRNIVGIVENDKFENLEARAQYPTMCQREKVIYDSCSSGIILFFRAF